MKRSFLLWAVYALSPAAFAQVAAPGNEFTALQDPPMGIASTICKEYANAKKLPKYKACTDGVAGSLWMAQKYAVGAGEYMGCIHGAYEGIIEGFNNGYQMDPKEVQNLLAEQDVENPKAIKAGKERALKFGKTTSVNDIINAYESVIGVKVGGQQKLPNTTPLTEDELLANDTFKGYEDGFSKEAKSLGLNYKKAIDRGWITEGSSIEDKILASAILTLEKKNYTPICKVSGTIFDKYQGFNARRLSYWDYYKLRSQKRFEEYGWKNPHWAWDVYNDDEANLQHFTDYKKGYVGITKEHTYMKDIFKIKEVPREITDENGVVTIARDENGNIIYDEVKEKIGTELVTDEVPLDQNDIKELRRIYVEGFKNAYQTYHARNYASKAYEKAKDDGFDDAKDAGIAIGSLAIEQEKKRVAYNVRYKTDSYGEYKRVLYRNYIADHAETVNIFRNNPVVKVNGISLVGNISGRNSLTRNELVSVDYSVTNLGEVSGDVTLSVDANMSSLLGLRNHSFRPAALSVENGTATDIAQVPSNARLRDDAVLKMSVSNAADIEKVTSRLNVNAEDGLVVRDFAEIKRVVPEMNDLTGQLDVTVELNNATGIDTDDSRLGAVIVPEVKVTIDRLGESKKVETLRIPGGKTIDPMLTFNLDPMKVISAGQISGEVTVTVNGRKVESKPFSISIKTDQKTAYVNYFYSLVKNQNADDRDKKLKDIIAVINSSVDNSLSRKVKWNKQHQVNGTIIGAIQKQYANVLAMNGLAQMPADEQRFYDSLANQLAKKVNNKGRTKVRGGFLGFGRKKNYLRALAKFSPSLPISAKAHK